MDASSLQVGNEIHGFIRSLGRSALEMKPRAQISFRSVEGQKAHRGIVKYVKAKL
jgi:hypothetical protein